MARKLDQREKRVLKFGVVCAAAILAIASATKWVGYWAQVRESLGAKTDRLKALNMSEAKRAGLMSIVPVFEMPQSEEEQKYPFREKFREQLKKAGIKFKPLQILRSRKSQEGGYKLLCLKCTGKCKFGQVLDLLAALKENPYLVGIEEFEIKCDPKKRKEFELNLTVSTFVK